MPHVGPVYEGRTFFCPHCGALYSVMPTRPSNSGSYTPKCVVCLTVMDRRETADVFRLIQRPEDVDA